MYRYRFYSPKQFFVSKFDLFSKVFKKFHGQRRALQLVFYVTFRLINLVKIFKKKVNS